MTNKNNILKKSLLSIQILLLILIFLSIIYFIAYGNYTETWLYCREWSEISDVCSSFYENYIGYKPLHNELRVLCFRFILGILFSFSTILFILISFLNKGIKQIQFYALVVCLAIFIGLIFLGYNLKNGVFL